MDGKHNLLSLHFAELFQVSLCDDAAYLKILNLTHVYANF